MPFIEVVLLVSKLCRSTSVQLVNPEKRYAAFAGALTPSLITTRLICVFQLFHTPLHEFGGFPMIPLAPFVGLTVKTPSSSITQVHVPVVPVVAALTDREKNITESSMAAKEKSTLMLQGHLKRL